MQMARMTAGPAGAAAAHMLPIMPESVHGIAGGGNMPLTQALPQMMGMTNPSVGGEALTGSGIMEHLGPLLGMGSLGAGAALLAALGAGKAYGAFRNWRQRRKAESSFGLPKFGSIIERDSKRGTDMFRDIRFVKFAANGALGYEVPENFRELTEKVAFTLGFLKAATAGASVNDFSPSERKVLQDLDDAVKTASMLVNRIRNLVRVKTASAGYDVSRDGIAKEAQARVRTHVPVNNSMGRTVFDPASKVAKAMETLGVDQPTLQMLCGGKQTTGVSTGILSLFAA